MNTQNVYVWRRVLLALAGIGLGAAVPRAIAVPPDSSYRLVWADEFDGHALDRSAWDTVPTASTGARNCRRTSASTTAASG